MKTSRPEEALAAGVREADLIEERYGSRYRLCKETSVDPGHVSRVLASRLELSVQNLQRDALVIQPEEDSPSG
jgi:hypothetical protein